MSLKEMPVKKLPTILLLDLRRRGIYMPPEVQRHIMWFKEMLNLVKLEGLKPILLKLEGLKPNLEGLKPQREDCIRRRGL